MIKFEDIKKANESIKTMTISRWDKKQGKEVSKEYAEVNQRIKAFRMLYPEGFITTDIISHENEVVFMKAEAGYYTEDGTKVVLGTGMAFENKKVGQINGTSYIENCETSAVGRALGMCGLGIDVSVASYEEVQNAMHQQEEATATPVFTCANCGGTFTNEKTATESMKRWGKHICGKCIKAARQTAAIKATAPAPQEPAKAPADPVAAIVEAITEEDKIELPFEF